ncbi:MULTISPECIES: hypothetical protein [Halomonas]|uniref:Uncharacterized protein n=1 Tax=Halomonas flagellata TaxID=2920385 RepID=A0ABS9RZZ0_9GAMM|nr:MULTISPECIES: hypothetical protein [Halomonas]MCH4565407.1 hypothetical protein [Halomonas flagellata]
MPLKNSSRLSMLSSVQTPLGFFVLVVLVVEAGLIALAGQNEGDKAYLYSIVGILVLLILVVAVIGYFKPWVLTGHPPPGIDEKFSQALAKDVFMAFDGYISNESDEERADAYEYLVDVCSSAKYYKDKETSHFAMTFIETVVGCSDIKRKPRSSKNA